VRSETQRAIVLVLGYHRTLEITERDFETYCRVELRYASASYPMVLGLYRQPDPPLEPVWVPFKVVRDHWGDFETGLYPDPGRAIYRVIPEEFIEQHRKAMFPVPSR